jgi:hypothetical protein
VGSNGALRVYLFIAAGAVAAGRAAQGDELESDGWVVSGSIATGPFSEIQDLGRRRIAQLQEFQDEHIEANRLDPDEVEHAIERAASEVRANRRHR